MDRSTRLALSRDLARLKDGERAAARPVFDLLWPAVLAFANKSIDDEALAEEAAQRALVRLFSQLQRYDEARDALSWAFALALWEVRSLLRDRGRACARFVGHDVDVEGGAPSAHDLLAQRELRALLDVAVDALPDLDRAAVLELLDDANPAQPLSARLRQRRRRALVKLKAIWRERYGSP